MRRILTIAVLASLMAIVAAGPALAGEVKGPPGQIENVNETGAVDHANSACAYSGLNDYEQPTSPANQNTSQVQTAADAFKYYGFHPSDIGWLCRGGGSH
jgi:hypothetical protein